MTNREKLAQMSNEELGEFICRQHAFFASTVLHRIYAERITSMEQGCDLRAKRRKTMTDDYIREEWVRRMEMLHLCDMSIKEILIGMGVCVMICVWMKLWW